jgi:hypothetical protein
MVVNWLETTKWTATAMLIIGFGLFSAGIDFGWYIQISGGVVWLAAAIVMKDKPLIATNGIMTTAGIIGKLFS